MGRAVAQLVACSNSALMGRAVAQLVGCSNSAPDGACSGLVGSV